jgi:uncharacterized protein (DUF952 family)
MKDNLIFHFAEKEALKLYQKRGEYSPPSLELEGFIHCSTGGQLNDTAKRLLGNRGELWLFIIDPKRVEPVIKHEKNEELQQVFPHIYGPLNTDAVLDKILIEAGKNESITIEFSDD